MARRKDRVRVVLDTNVIVGALLSTSRQSVNQQVVRLWLHRKLQLIVSEEVAAEYQELVERLAISTQRAEAFRQRLQRQDSITHVGSALVTEKAVTRMITSCWLRLLSVRHDFSSPTI